MNREQSPLAPLDVVQLLQTLASIVEQVGRDKDFVWRIASEAVEKAEKSANGDLPKVQLQQAVIEVLERLEEPELLEKYRSYCSEHNEVYEALYQSSRELFGESRQILVGPTSKDKYYSWERSRIAKALQREGGIPLDVAEKVAWAVEQKVLHSGGRYITTALIRELVNSELFLKGYRYSLKKQAVLGIPKYNLNKLLYSQNRQSPGKGIDNLAQRISSVTLRQYAFEEVFSQEVVDAHLRGAIHIEGLEWPLKFFSLFVRPRQTSGFGKITKAVDWITVLLGDIQKLSSFVIHPLYLGDMETTPISAKATRALLIALSQDFTVAASCRLFVGDIEGKLCRSLCESYRQACAFNKRAFLPDLLFPVTLSSLDECEEVWEMAISMRNTTFLFPNNSFFAAEGYPHEKCVMDAVTINLVQAACNAGKGELDGFWRQLEEVVSLVVKVHLDKKRFLFNLSEGPLYEFFHGRSDYDLDNFCCFLQISGLPEAVRFLCDEEMTTEEGKEIAVQTLAHLADIVQSFEHKYSLQLKLVHCDGREAAERFVQLDIARFPELRRSLPETLYTPGPHFSWSTSLTNEQRLQLEGELHQYVASYVSLLPEMNASKLRDTLKFAMEETQAMAVKIR